MAIQRTTLFLLFLTLFAACKSSKKVVVLNEEVMANPGAARLWYTHSNLLTKGTKSVTLFSSPAIMRRIDSVNSAVYTFNFSPKTLLEMGQYRAGDSVMDAASSQTQTLNVPYYFVTSNQRRILGIWQADAYRMYMVYRFIAYKDNGGYIVELVQLQ